MTLKLLVRLDQIVHDTTGAVLGQNGDQLAINADITPADRDKVAVFDDGSSPLDMGHFRVSP